MRHFIDMVVRRLISPSETLDGYEQPELADVIFRKTLAYRPQEPWTGIAGAETVLDFGGGCGLHYKQAMDTKVRWAVVETPTMVERAKELETDHLRFFTDISEASDWLRNVDVMHSNGALQYTPEPEEKLLQLVALRAKRLLWFRMFLGDGGSEVQSSLLGDNGPGSLSVKEKTVRYPRTSIPERTFLAAHRGYLLAERTADSFRFELTRLV